MRSKEPFEYRIGDRLRLRKIHPCGGWIWKVVRLGADIGLVCEMCNRRVLLDRSSLEQRTKSVLERGPEDATVPAPKFELPTLSIQLAPGTVLEPVRTVSVHVNCYFSSSSEAINGRLSTSDLVRIVAMPSGGTNIVKVAPVEAGRFESTFVPGGLRGRADYEGFDIDVEFLALARDFKTVTDLKAGDSEGTPLLDEESLIGHEGYV